MKHKLRKPATTPNPRMGAADLAEFRLRSAAMQAASHNLLLIGEAYQAWIIKMLAKYGLAGRYDVDPKTGELRQHAESKNKS